MKKENNVFIATRGTKELSEKLQFHAKAQDLSASQVLRRLIAEWVEEQDKKHRKQLTLAD